MGINAMDVTRIEVNGKTYTGFYNKENTEFRGTLGSSLEALVKADNINSLSTIKINGDITVVETALNDQEVIQMTAMVSRMDAIKKTAIHVYENSLF